MLASLVQWAIFGFFVIAWGFVLLPPAVRLLGGVIRPSDTIGSFQQKMSVLGSSSPAGLPAGPLEVETPNGPVLDLGAHRVARGAAAGSLTAARSAEARRAARKRRRDLFCGLLAGTGLTFLVALLAGGTAWLLFVVVALLFAGYTTLLWQAQQTARERSRKVAFLRDEVKGIKPEQVRALRQASSGLR